MNRPHVRLKPDTYNSGAASMDASSDNQFEYIVVGSGAGGGTLAARLAEAGRRVLLIEAGGDAHQLAGGDAIDHTTSRLPDDYDVPAFHTLASENDALSWSFFVRHHADAALDRRDPKYVSRADGCEGIFYPRAGTLGGCTAHNAMIFVYPHNADWDDIATLTGDASWSASSMRRYFQSLESCRHRPVYRWLARLGINPTRHGWRGWLPVETTIPLEAFTDRNLRRVVIESALAAMRQAPNLRQRLRWFLTGAFDPNDWRLVRENASGIRYLPLTTDGHRRYGTRERVLEVAGRLPDRLTIWLDTLATRVLLDENRRAYGIEYRKGARLYRAHVKPNGSPGTAGTVRASREVILCGGVFNTPQLLMLSGIGPEGELRRHGIEPVQVLERVGKNLQDRYEVAVVNRLEQPWEMLRGATFTEADQQYQQWKSSRSGIYATNGIPICVIARSTGAQPTPDLFCYALLTDFRGYKPGYSKVVREHQNYLTWVVLKGHTNNTGGEVTLTSKDPRVRPAIHFKYFEEGTDTAGDDLMAVVKGVSLVRRMTAGLRTSLGMVEEMPGPD